ncbi:MAG: hypothetical protein Q9196_005835 [Gyalolechia fulgens]
MKSMIVSVIVGFAALTINGVTGVVVPVKSIKRVGASVSHSEATGKVDSAIVKRDTDVDSALPTVNVPVTTYPNSPANTTDDTTDDNSVDDDDDDSTTTTCVHTTEGFIQCGDVMTKRDAIPTPSTTSLSKRVKKKRTPSPPIPFPNNTNPPLPTEGFPDISGICSPDGYHWVQKPDPGYCWELNNMKPTDPAHHDLWNYCYARVPCGQHTPQKRDDVAVDDNQLAAGCHASGQPLYFQSPTFRDVCNKELVKGSAVSEQYYPGVGWDTGLMDLCFVSAGCDGGEAFGSG